MLKNSFLKELGILDDDARETETVTSKVMDARMKFVQSVEWDLGITIASKTDLATNYTEATNRFLLNKEKSLFVEFTISAEYSSEMAGSGMSSHFIRRQDIASIKNTDFSITVVKKVPFECPDGCDDDCNSCIQEICHDCDDDCDRCEYSHEYEFLRYPTEEEILQIFKDDLEKQAECKKSHIEELNNESQRLHAFTVQATHDSFKQELDQLKGLTEKVDILKRQINEAKSTLYNAFIALFGYTNISCPHPEEPNSKIFVEIDGYDNVEVVEVYVSKKICPENCKEQDCDDCQISFHFETREATTAEFMAVIKQKMQEKKRIGQEKKEELKEELKNIEQKIKIVKLQNTI